MIKCTLAISTCTLAISCVVSVPPTWTPLIVGEDLQGWTIVNGDKSTWVVKDGMIICSGKPTSVMRTNKMYENFILELDWRHMVENGNAGLFIWSDPIPAVGAPFTRSIEVQVMDGKELDWYTTHGDIFSIWGAKMTPDRPHPNGYSRCLPSERRSKPAPEWNHYTVRCIDGTIKLAVNGAFVSGGYDISPRKGYICLEAEGTEAHFKNISIMELPPSAPATTEIAEEDKGFTTLYNGVNLEGWNTTSDSAKHWTVEGWILLCDGSNEALLTSSEFENYEIMLDYRCSTENTGAFVIVDGEKIELPSGKANTWNRFVTKGKRGRVGIGGNGNPVNFCNIFIRTVK